MPQKLLTSVADAFRNARTGVAILLHSILTNKPEAENISDYRNNYKVIINKGLRTKDKTESNHNCCIKVMIEHTGKPPRLCLPQLYVKGTLAGAFYSSWGTRTRTSILRTKT